MERQQRAPMGLFHTLFVVFLVLRLTGLVRWEWYWVASPMAAEVTKNVLSYYAARQFAKKGGGGESNSPDPVE